MSHIRRRKKSGAPAARFAASMTDFAAIRGARKGKSPNPCP
jgi:hypothetical protein